MDDLKEIVQIPVNPDEFYFIHHAMSYFMASHRGDIIEALTVSTLLRSCPLARDPEAIDDLIVRMNKLASTIYPDADKLK